MNDYVFVSIGQVGLIPSDLELVFEWVKHYDKEKRLIELLSEIESGLVLIFVETKREADFLDGKLHEKGFPTTSIHGDRTQSERQEALFSFRSGRNPILIATRGLDVGAARATTLLMSPYVCLVRCLMADAGGRISILVRPPVA